MKQPQISFEQIINATVRMVRTSWQAKLCLFLQRDDHGALRVRAADGEFALKASPKDLDLAESAFTRCFARNEIVEKTPPATLTALNALLKTPLKDADKYVFSPVTGESRVLGILILGPFPENHEIKIPRAAELLSAGALCAVLSAHWRMYEWMSSFVPQISHELRTPLTAVQGSIGMVLGGMFGQVDSDVKEMLEMAQKGCERTVRAIEEYINNQKSPDSK